MKTKSNPWNRSAICVGVVVMLLIQLLGALGIGALLYSGRIPESATEITSVVVRTAATIAAAIATWLHTKREPVREILAVVSISMTIMVIVAMLFWQIDLQGILMGFGIAIATAVLCGGALRGPRKGRSGKFKNANMVKMYKKFGR